jgi:hypothetical protein
MNDGLVWILLFGIIAVVAAVFYTQARGHKQHIRDYLLKKGARDIAITWVWFTHERDSVTYDVVYTDQLGNPQRTQCKIYNDRWYWTKPPEV